MTSAVGLVAVLKKWGLGGSVIVLCLGAVIALSAGSTRACAHLVSCHSGRDTHTLH